MCFCGRIGGMILQTTEKGYENRNKQTNLGSSKEISNHYNQVTYLMKCGYCSFEYVANGCDVWQRKCPKCQGGKK